MLSTSDSPSPSSSDSFISTSCDSVERVDWCEFPRVSIPGSTLSVITADGCDENEWLNGELGSALCPSSPPNPGLVGVDGPDFSCDGALGVVGDVAGSYSFGANAALTGWKAVIVAVKIQAVKPDYEISNGACLNDCQDVIILLVLQERLRKFDHAWGAWLSMF